MCQSCETLFDPKEIPAELRQYFEEVTTHCGAPYRRVVERLRGDVPSANGSTFTHGKTHAARAPLAAVGQQERTAAMRTIGWEPSCACDAGVPVPATVLDCFAGSGTTGVVARALGRHAVLCDLSYPYLHDQARERLSLRMLDAWANGGPARAEDYGDLPMFRNGSHLSGTPPNPTALG